MNEESSVKQRSKEQLEVEDFRKCSDIEKKDYLRAWRTMQVNNSVHVVFLDDSQHWHQVIPATGYIWLAWLHVNNPVPAPHMTTNINARV
jgi:hypothetical protein